MQLPLTMNNGRIRLFIVGLFLVILTLLTTAVVVSATGGAAAFDRASIEYIPALSVANVHHGDNFTINTLSGWKWHSPPKFGTKYLPLRYAVERVPTLEDRAEEHIPLRDAVEHVPFHPLPTTVEEQLKSQQLKSSSSINGQVVINHAATGIDGQKQQEPGIEKEKQHEQQKEEEYRVLCYVASWAKYRSPGGAFGMEDIKPELCTHLVYSFAALHPDNLTIVPGDTATDFDSKFYTQVTSPLIRDKAKVLIAIGGWTDSAGDKYSRLVQSAASRRRFVQSVITFLTRHNFDGLHFDWIYPVCWQSRCAVENIIDRSNYVTLIMELWHEFKRYDPPYELGVAVSGYKEVIDVGYDIKLLNEYVDFMSVMTYDYHGAWESKTGHISPLYKTTTATESFDDNYNTESTLSHVIRQGADPSKLLMGVPFYGQSFLLDTPDRNKIGDPATEPGDNGQYTQQPGILAYYEICDKIKNDGWMVGRPAGKDGTESYAYKGKQWVGYDDLTSIRTKANYVQNRRLGGIMVWTIDLDDFDNRCCQGSYPLLSEINRILRKPTTNPHQKKLGNCEKPIPLPFPTTVATPNTTTPDDSYYPFKPSTTTNWWDSGSSISATPSTTTTTITTPTTTTTTAATYWTSSSKPTVPVYPTRPWWPPHLTPRPKPPQKPTHSTSSVSSWQSTTLSTTTTTAIPSTTTTTRRTTTANIAPDVNDCVSGAYQADESDCNSYYYCIYGRLRKQYCAPGLHWSYATTTCDWPAKANCRVQSENSNEIEQPFGGVVFSSESPTTILSETLSTATSSDSSQQSQSPTAGSIVKCSQQGEHYSIPGDCGGFYICDRGRLVQRRCPPGLYWHQINRSCDWNYNVKCTTSSHQTGGVGDPFKIIQIANSNKSDSSSSSARMTHHNHNNNLTASSHTNSDSIMKSGKKTNCVSGQFKAHPDDCSKYYLCMWGEYRETTCPPGLHWDKNLHHCDWSNKVSCVGNNGHNSVEQQHPVKQDNTNNNPTTTISSTRKPGTTSITWWGWSPTDPHHQPSTSSSSISSINTPVSTWWSSSSSSSSPSSTSTSISSTDNNGQWKPPATSTESWQWFPTFTTVTLPTEKPKHPLTTGSNGGYKMVCYFTNWAWYRTGKGKYFPEHVDTNLCTHIVYGFAVLDFEKLTIKIYDSWADIDNRFYERVVALKARGVKVLIAIGGWNDSAGDKYSRLVNSATARQTFVASVLRFLERFGFDGLDLDWEYPKCWQVNCNRGPTSDKEGFTALVRELRAAFNPHGYLLSAAVSPSKVVIDAGYDVKALSDTLDWISVMTYDYHGQWDKKTGHLAPIYYTENDELYYFNINYTLHYWLEKGADSRKLVMGIPMYGQGFSLGNTSNTGLNSPSYGPSEAGEYTRAAGFLAYYEICDKIREQGWTVVRDPKNRRGPYAFRGNQWIGFDDIVTIKQKVGLIKKFNLGGGMIWALDLDDFQNTCGHGHYPLLRTIVDNLADPSFTGDCYQSGGVNVVIPSEMISSSVASWTPTVSNNNFEISSTTTSVAVITTDHTTSTTTTAVDDWTSATAVMSKPSDEHFKIICYFTNWAWYRGGRGKYLVSDIDYDLCTHIVYGFAVLDSAKLVMKPHDTWADIDNNFYERVTALKKHGVRVLLAIGGWNDSAGNKYSRLVNSEQSRRKFIQHAVQFLNKYHFDGLDLDWEYPKCWQVNCKKGPESDKQGFADFVSELHTAFKKHQLLLSAAVSPNKIVIDEGYDVPLLSAKLDWISVMTYDYHGQWDKKTGHVAPMYQHPLDENPTFNANYSLRYWVEKGADPRKLIMGMPMYGQSFTLASARNHTLNSRTYGGGEPGESTKARGFLSYYEICSRIQTKGWKVVYDAEGRMGPYAKHGNQWVSFDDQAMIRHKSEFVYYNNLGGAMIWALDLDDFRDVCKCGKYPLLRTINQVLRRNVKNEQHESLTEDCLLQQSNDLNNSVAATVKKKDERAGDVQMVIIGQEQQSWWQQIETCPHGQVKRHPTDCAKYATCIYGVYQPMQSCPAGLHFNDKSKTCDWPSKAGGCLSSYLSAAETDDIDVTGRNATQGTHSNLETAIDEKNEQNEQGEEMKKKEMMVACYVTNWSSYRYNSTLSSAELNQVVRSGLCTHIVYAFAILDPTTLAIKSNDSLKHVDVEFFKSIHWLKKHHGSNRNIGDGDDGAVKVVLGLGGWYDSSDDKYSRLVGNRKNRLRFINQAIVYLKKRNFDGLELDWEYPTCWQMNCDNGANTDREGLSELLSEMSSAFRKNNLTVSLAVSASKHISGRAYEMSKISEYVDWLSLMTYDYHGYWEKRTGHIAPLYSADCLPFERCAKEDDSTIDSSVSYWLSNGILPSKLILGLPTYGQTFELSNTEQTAIGAKVLGPGNVGKYTQVPGFLSFYEICDTLSEGGWSFMKEDSVGSYAFLKNQWISYNDVLDIRRKGAYIREKGLGGAALWSVDLDDFAGICGCGVYPILSAINHQLGTRSSITMQQQPPPPIKDCMYDNGK